MLLVVNVNTTSDLEWIEEVIQASTGISQLRQLVLELAMTGRLVKPPREYSSVEDAVEAVIQKIPAKVRESIRYKRSSGKNIILVESKPDHWHSVFLEELAFLQTGATPSRSKPAYFQGDIKWLVSGDVNNPDIADCRGRISRQALQDTNCKIIPKDSVLIALNGQGKTRGTVAVLRVDATCNQSLIGITPREPKVLTSEFLFWYLKCNYMNIRKITGLNDRRGLNMNHVSAFQIQVPPLIEQNLIIERVKELMVLCDDLERKIAKRDILSLSARKSLVDAVSTAQTPEELQIAWGRIQDNWQVIAGTPESIESLRELILDILFKPKKVDGWEVKSFGDLLTIANGDRSKNYPSKEHRVSTGVPFVNAGHLKEGLVDLSAMDYISQEKFKSLSGGKFNDGDILFCLRGSLGKSALVKNIGKGTVASSLAIFKVGVEINTEYLFWFLQSGMARMQIKKFDNGTAQPNLSAKSVLKFQIPLPKLPEQKLIVLKVGELMKL